MGFKNARLPLFIGSRISLGIMEETDVTNRMVGWICDEEVNRYLAHKTASKKCFMEWVRSKDESEKALLFLITLNESQRPIGMIKLEHWDNRKQIAEMGSCIDIALIIGEKDCWGKGLMAEAMNLLIDYSFNQLNLNTVYLGVAADNTRAVRLYHRLGFIEFHRDENGWEHTEPICDHIWMKKDRVLGI